MSPRTAEKTVNFVKDWPSLGLPASVTEVLGAAPSVVVPERREDLLNWALGREVGATDWSGNNREDKGEYEVAFDVPGRGSVVEARVVKARNGLSVNYPEPAMRRRDPNAMVIGDSLPTDKPTYESRFGE
ncbi:MAG: DUF4914 family protein, partial [bacterium]